MAGYIDPLAVTRTTGPDLAVTPAPFDPNNPLGLTAAAPGYLPADQRTPLRDPDLGWSEGMSGGPIIATADQLPVDLRNQVTQAQQDWGNMDASYWAAHSQKPLPLVLGALGAIAAPFALSALGFGGAAGAAGGAGATGAGATGAGSAAGLAAGATGALSAGTAGATVSELVVTAAAQGLSIPTIAAALGVPAATVGSILSNSGGSNVLQGSQGGDTLSGPPAEATTVDPLTVTAPSTPSFAGPVAATLGGAGVLGALSGGGGGGTPLATATPDLGLTPASTVSTGPLTTPPAETFANAPPSLLQAIKSGDLTSVGNWITANPLQAVELGLLSASALSTVTGAGAHGSSGSGTYTPVALPASFSATSPHFALAGRGDARVMPHQDWTRYGQGPEQSFFTGITQPAPVVDLTVKPKGFAQGGFAVRGEGDGRSDSIDAKLSDGEYVVDAETVALLGNGSNKAGAEKLDRFRVNLRKDKGRNLARGGFSVRAKEPESYMVGGR